MPRRGTSEADGIRWAAVRQFRLEARIGVLERAFGRNEGQTGKEMKESQGKSPLVFRKK
jgi:hypothetical protein